MQPNGSKNRAAAKAVGFAALCAALMMAPGGAAAAPTETVLHSFCSQPNCSDGANPFAGLIADSSGNLYGTTAGGGGCAIVNCGVVFRLSPGGTYTVLHAFTGGSDGSGPEAGLIADSSGNAYGTTTGGGAGAGVVFKLSPGGTFTVLDSFSGSDGRDPGGLIADGSGNLYGTTFHGGASDLGVVFKLVLGGTFTVLHSFSGSDGGKSSRPDCRQQRQSLWHGIAWRQRRGLRPARGMRCSVQA